MATTQACRPRLSRRESREQTRRRILDAAAEEFAERGFHGASLAEVADRAGYTIGAVYSNFAGKDALFHALMAERLRLVEEDLAAAAAIAPDDADLPKEELIERELDRLQAAEDAVPAGWWRLLNEYRAAAAADPAAWAELVAAEGRCRALIAGHIASFATRAGIALPMTPLELAEVTSALSDGLRAAHAEGRSSVTSGEGLRLVVASMIDAGRAGRRLERGRDRTAVAPSGPSASGGDGATLPG